MFRSRSQLAVGGYAFALVGIVHRNPRHFTIFRASDVLSTLSSILHVSPSFSLSIYLSIFLFYWNHKKSLFPRSVLEPDDDGPNLFLGDAEAVYSSVELCCLSIPEQGCSSCILSVSHDSEFVRCETNYTRVESQVPSTRVGLNLAPGGITVDRCAQHPSAEKPARA